MLLTLLMLTPLRPDTADAVLDRVKAMTAKPFSVDYEMTRGDVPGTGAGSVTIVRPLRMVYKIRWDNADFDYYTSENRTIEMIRSRKIYYELGPLDHLYQPSSNFTSLAEDAFPLVLLVGDPRAIFGNLPRQLAAQETINGVNCDHVHGGNDKGGFDAYVDAEGKLIRFRYDIVGRSGKTSVNFDFKNYVVGKDLPLSEFEPAIPPGFNPSASPKPTWPLSIGTPFPTSGWVTAQGQPATIAFKKPVLVIVTDSECEPSTRAASAISKLSKTLPVWLFSVDGKAPKALSGYKLYRDKGNRTLDRFYAPGTPLFVLVGADGRVKHSWFGFDPDEEASFVKDVKAALDDKD